MAEKITKEILLNVESKEVRCAHLHFGQLHDLTIERKRERQQPGNIYRGRVTNILPNIQSAFIEIDEGENGFIHIRDILENRKKFEELFDLDFELEEGREEKKGNIEELLKKDQTVLVQVVKEPIGSKGARLTSNLSIAGRYLVLIPSSSHRGVSRKIEDRLIRDRLKKLIRSFEMPHDMGLICRTASKIATSDMLIEEAHELIKIWKEILDNFEKSSKPTLLYAESDLVKRAVITAIDRRYDRVLIDDRQAFQQAKNIYRRYSKEHSLKIEYFRDKVPIFERFNVERELEKSLKKKIWLPNGGYIYFEQTEAMHTIDVNSGRSTVDGSDVEETLVRINLAAAEEIARQLRLLNVGGVIVIDFIDMRLRKSQRRVLERLKECMKEDSAKCTILGMSEFGLVEMTRQRSRSSLAQTLLTSCPYCSGNGLIKSCESMTIEIERALKKAIQLHKQYGIKLVVHPMLELHMTQRDRDHLNELAEGLNAQLSWETDDSLHLNDYCFFSTITKQKIEV